VNERKSDLHLGINAISLLTPLTGIGQYTLNLALELQKKTYPIAVLLLRPFLERALLC